MNLRRKKFPMITILVLFLALGMAGCGRDDNPTANHTMAPGLDVTNYITLGNDNCKVRMHYRIMTELVELEV